MNVSRLSHAVTTNRVTPLVTRLHDTTRHYEYTRRQLRVLRVVASCAKPCELNQGAT